LEAIGRSEDGGEILVTYYFSTELEMPFDRAVETVTEALKAKGFGVLTTIDVKETLQKKLGVDFRPYRILGACNPQMAYQALQAEPRIGTMLPCNVILRETEAGKIEVSAIDPVASMQAIENPKLADIAGKVRSMLESVIQDLHR
jgi:uncharacterized protein (DUF302 family)